MTKTINEIKRKEILFILFIFFFFEENIAHEIRKQSE